ncbi:vascular cell adhesion protein 1-like [Sparus aurata]|uniref:vascular cell adhesion protein 1-like n=1 Tax=Sparus aurata TaxID=8175 RepID=UPI0011C0CDA3|nr:vascular cell adhesion protein 1-like [Sparus aurata]
MSVLCVNLVTANMLLSLFFLSGVLADCPEDSDLFITAPKKMEALSGSCLQIPCSFRPRSKKDFKSSREIFGVWIKSNHFISNNPHDVIFNSSGTNNIYPMKITGNLREKNCTTLFSGLITSYTNTYYFRIESNLLKATAYCDPLQIIVEDSPRRPTIEISGDLKEKESVTITCSAFTPCPHSPPKLTWNLQQDSHNKIEENTDGTFTTKIQETITLSDQHDGYNISCSATYPVNEGKHVKTAEETKTLSVSYDQEFVFSVYITVKILGVIMLYSAIIIFECCFRSRCCNKPVKDTDEAGCVNRVQSSSLTGALAACTQKSGIFITAQSKMEALSGSCLQIPCSFRPEQEQEFDSKSKIFGVWIKNDTRFKNDPKNVIFNSSGTNNIYPMKITGNLSERNCTTLFSSLITSYTNRYYFRIENCPFKATAVCDPLQITVEDSPRRPTIEISGDLKEKESVTITCSAFTPCPHSPPKLTWNLQQDSHNKIEEDTRGTFTTKIQETITLSDQHDGYNISCSATYPVNEGKHVKTAEETKTLSVSYAPKNTSVSISASAGSWVNLTCSSRAKPPVSSFTWFRNSKEGLMNVSEGHFYSVNVTDGGDYYCVATNNFGSQKSPEIHLTVEGLPWEAALGGIIGIIVLICLVVCLW